MEAFLRIAVVKADSDDKAITTIINIYALVYEQIIMITQLEEYVTTLFNAEKDSSMISTVGRVPYAGETVCMRAL